MIHICTDTPVQLVKRRPGGPNAQRRIFATGRMLPRSQAGSTTRRGEDGEHGAMRRLRLAALCTGFASTGQARQPQHDDASQGVRVSPVGWPQSLSPTQSTRR
ncbi:hypothetical protein JDV02_006883 [Purpureocillium takamizusanense]|uniref:Uncharacterized protein n=1 Tax=Purpureocillium takamizusanense TaxID=2060973 RepID=A0A9Q8QJ78_9HYPO|nr:uncharacterized protein JDV02_006883 [Purpureocillium takamizusanense]UNI20833.1 hypothetical protein JDV02_006883 [Purpureocillium takamizusanense]